MAIETPLEQDIGRLVERLDREANDELAFLAREAMITLNLVDHVRPGLIDTILEDWESNAGVLGR